MNLSAPFIARPVGTTLLTLAICLVGVLGYFELPVSPLPEVDFPTLQVRASLPGASPETMASAVAAPLERQLGHIAGVTEMTSTSTLGGTTVVLQFDLDRNIDAAARDVQAAINAASGQLPTNLPSLPTYRKVNPADPPVLIMAMTSPTYTKAQMYDAASSVLQQRLSQVQGVGQVIVGGGALPAVRIDVNPTALNRLGLTLDDVRATLAAANRNQPKGMIGDGEHAWSIATTDQLEHAAEYRPLVVAYRNGAAIRLSDVATVSDSVEDVRAAGVWKGRPAILLLVWRQPGANIVETVRRVRDLMPELQAQVPSGMKLDVVLDRTPPIRDSVRDVEVALLLAVVLVILVVFAFLRSVRATLIPSIAVPTSLVGTFGVMYLAGYSIDNLSLMALAIATGFVVDDAIVVIENITRYLEQGMPAHRAALVGAKEIGFTVLSISLSLVAVFLPILLMGGIVGRLFREFAVTLSAAIAVSLVISLTTTPMMCAYLLRREGERRHGRVYRASEWAFNWILGHYETTLRWVLRHRFITLMVTLATVGLTVYLYVIIPKGFFPQQDNSRLAGSLHADQDASFQFTSGLMEQFARTIGEDSAVEGVIAFTGGMRDTTNNARAYVPLTPVSQRRDSADQIIARLRKNLGHIAGARMFLQSVQDLRIGGHSSSAQYQYTLRSEDLASLDHWAPIVLQKLRGLPTLADVNSDQQNSGLESHVEVDRATASRLNLTPQAIDNLLYDGFGQRQVSTIYKSVNQYHVVMETTPRFWQSPAGLRFVYARAAPRQMSPLLTFAQTSEGTTPLAVNHDRQFPSVTLSFNLRIGAALGDAVQQIQDATRQLRVPATIHGSFSGAAQAFQASLASEPTLIALALIAVYIVLGILYESYIHPITILSTLPSAGVGALLALMLFHLDLTIIALIGIFLLIGIVKKNAILMIDFAIDAERRLNLPPEQAIYQACVLRLRPITMTTMAAMLGGLPLAIGVGSGSELRRPLGIAIVGGLAVSQVLTLYTTPVVYLYLDRLRIAWARLIGRPVNPALPPIDTPPDPEPEA